ncbi:unannotated protein [freshwater metagenome]|uniref:Unannotated protein n=1 Tax=freshwater metagenome TaxID=449393 RepID=A0A6J7GUN8_9ZZZZ
MPNRGTLTDLASLQRRAGAHDRAFSDNRRANQMRVGKQGHIASEVDVNIDPHTGRVQHGDTGAHPLCIDAITHEGTSFSKLHAIVDPHDLRRVTCSDCFDTGTRSPQNRDDVGEVFLSLRVCRCDLGERRHELHGIKGIHARVDLVNREDRFIGVAVFDNLAYLAIGTAHNAAISRRIFKHCRKHCRGRTRSRVVSKESFEGRPSQQRGITSEYDYGSTINRANGIQSDAHSMPCAALFLLHDGRHPWRDLGDVRSDLLASMSNNYDNALR